MTIGQNDLDSKFITQEIIRNYESYLIQEERSSNTIHKYIHDIRALWEFLKEEALCKEKIMKWKEHLIQGYAPASVNSMLAAVNNFLTWLGKPLYRVKPIKIQHDVFLKPEKELTRGEYSRLVRTARETGRSRLSYVIQTICATGIRVSELQFITVEALEKGKAEIIGKGKRRTVFLPKELCIVLKGYLKGKTRKCGPVFLTRSGKPLNRSNIWRAMKSLCKTAGVSPEKVYPHNLRHLFARTYYTLEKDLSRLADLLGHTSINTTRIYTAESGMVHKRQVNRLGLIVT